MESLLSLAFDNLSSYDGAKIKKGLKQVEGLLAQICLSGPSSSPKKQQQPTSSSPTKSPESSSSPPRKGLPDLGSDPAFREFFKLQEGFEWNVAHRLLSTLDWLVARGGDGQYDLLIVNTLDLIQGILLLHPPSKILFSRSVHMNVRPPPHSPFPKPHKPNPSYTAHPRPNRTRQLPRDPMRDHHHARRRAPRHPAKHARL